MVVQLESESDEEADPYWAKIRIDELYGLGNAMEIVFSDTDLMPELEEVSDSDDSVAFILTPVSSDTSQDDNNQEGFNDFEMLDLVEDREEDRFTAFNADMLVNAEGNIEGTQTELYDSGALRHMSKYQDHFKNCVSITPKLITAADKQYFQAVGKGDLRIKIPSDSADMTILLRDVLHCSDMGLTIVSIGKITAAGCKCYDFKELCTNSYSQQLSRF